MFFKTESGSLYEINFEDSLARRLHGTTKVERITDEWREFKEVSGVPEIGASYTFVWDIQDTEQGPLYKTTITSRLTWIGDALPEQN